MKKLLITSVALAAMSFCAQAANIAWGNFYGSYEDASGDTFAGGTALLYVLTGDASTAVTFDSASGTWNLNGATLVATSGFSADDEGWGAMDFYNTDVAAVKNITSPTQEMQYFTTLIVDQAGVTSIDNYKGNYVQFDAQGQLAVVEPQTPTYGVDAS